jgi:RNA polymerase sigma-70 factor, ECF subfamily
VDDLALTREVERAAAGSHAAFAAVVRATQIDVQRCCAALVDSGSAEDLAQETFLRAYRVLPSFRGEASVRTWVLGIARHVCVDELRRRDRRRRTLSHRPPQPAALDPTADADLRLLVAALAPERREAFVLTQVVGLGYDEAAVVCGCPVGTIRSRVSRARADLVAMLGRDARSASA